uniref:Uncharacterized protein n=1 Tax=viral metagenome TaxID=1070528 RepID=A0A6H1ZQB0_9ZZZZ
MLEHEIRQAIYDQIEYYSNEKPICSADYHMRILAQRIYASMVRAGWLENPNQDAQEPPG